MANNVSFNQASTSQSTPLAVTALGEIADQLGKKDWNFKVDPCTGNDQSWTTTTQVDTYYYNNTLNCNCNISDDGVCHVVELYQNFDRAISDKHNTVVARQGSGSIIKLSAFTHGVVLGLTGILPPALAKLPHLKTIFFVQFPLACSDLIANYLSGNIPQEWASMQLEFLSISTNNLSGPIPTYLGNITTLKIMRIESNWFSGFVPPKLGNLVNLELLILSANNLTGELPATLINLTKLIEFRISSNNFTGRVPDFFQTWKQRQKLEIQASGPEGPIPPSISALSTLTELDLSFNRLKGNVPDLGGLARLNLMCLTNDIVLFAK
ncbi:putative leucine-rich repeat receptor-like serine/threonine-protein kinase [Quercus suber]|uniref:Leucine-rich repeat receptor-like serine/threonine-protein kinase n=1 Tax=Quercus suber TaxID=58331 RepID=A0AAW0LD22_QUESU